MHEDTDDDESWTRAEGQELRALRALLALIDTPEFSHDAQPIRVPPWIRAGQGEPYEFLDRLSGQPSKERDQAIFWLRDLDYGGCDSGMYMPAVEPWQALGTMGEHGDEVLDYLYDAAGDVWPRLCPGDGDSWSGIAVKILSEAVQHWARQTLDQLGVERR